MWLGAEDSQFEAGEPCYSRPIPHFRENQVVFDDRKVLHFILRMRRFRLVRSRLRKARNAAGPEYSSELAEHFPGVRDIMQGVKAKDPIDTFRWQIDSAAVEEQES